MSLAYDVSVDQIVPARRSRVRAQTISIKRLSKRELAKGRVEREAIEAEDGPVERPKTRGDCVNGPRPCPWVGCRQNLYLDVYAHSGAIKLNFPHLEPDEMAESCALDVADRGGATLDDVAAAINITRERARQIDDRAVAKLPKTETMREILTALDERGAEPGQETLEGGGIVMDQSKILHPRDRERWLRACRKALSNGKTIVLLPCASKMVRARDGKNIRLWFGSPRGRFVAPRSGVFDAREMLRALAGEPE